MEEKLFQSEDNEGEKEEFWKQFAILEKERERERERERENVCMYESHSTLSI